MNATLFIEANGTVRYIYSDDLHADFGADSIRRASHVEPAPGGWTADMGPSGGPVLGPFAKRGEALAAEVKWLESHSLVAG